MSFAVLLVTVAAPIVSALLPLNPTSPAPVTFRVMLPEVAVSTASFVAASTAALPVIRRPAPLIPVTAVMLILPLVAVVTPAASATVALPVVTLSVIVMAPAAADRVIPPEAVPLVVVAAVVIPATPSTVPTVNPLVSPVKLKLLPTPAREAARVVTLLAASRVTSPATVVVSARPLATIASSSVMVPPAVMRASPVPTFIPVSPPRVAPPIMSPFVSVIKALPPWVRSSRLETLVAIREPVRPTVPVVLAALLMSSAAELAVIVEVAVRRMSLPSVGPF